MRQQDDMREDEAEELARAAKVRGGQQLFAKVRAESKYAYQNQLAQADPVRWGGFPFMVRVDPAHGEYCVQGGPGGQYRLEDVALYVIEDGIEVRLS